jgi:hypothetical protein
MKLIDRIRLGFTQIRQGIIGSILVILAVAAAAALSAATASFLNAYLSESEQLVNNPAFREIIVQIEGLDRSQLPVQEIDPQNMRNSLLNIEDIDRIIEEVPAISHGYTANRMIFVSNERFMDGKGNLSIQGPPGQSGRARAGADEKASPKEAPVADETDFFQDLSTSTIELPRDEFQGMFITPSFFAAYGIQAAEGSLPTELDLKAGNSVMVIGSALADELTKTRSLVGEKLSLNFQTYTVIAVLEPSGYTYPGTNISMDNLMYTVNPVLKARNINSQLAMLRFAVDDSRLLTDAENQLSRFFELEYPQASLDIYSSRERLSSELEKQERILFVLVFLSFTGIFIASLNLVNLLLIRIVKSSKRIGIMKALGFSGSDIQQHFFIEAVLLSVIGAIIGIAAAPFVSSLLQSAFTSTTELYWIWMIAGGIAALGISLLFSLFPASQAKTMDIADALRMD